MDREGRRDRRGRRKLRENRYLCPFEGDVVPSPWHNGVQGVPGSNPGVPTKQLPKFQYFSAPCKGGDFQWVRIPPGSWLLRPVAIGAVVEETKPSEPPVQRVALGDSASMQAETRVNAEQASKHLTWEPTPQRQGEGRCRRVG